MNTSSESPHHIDLRGTPCPVNFIRCRLTIEALGPRECLHVDLDKGEPEAIVIPGLRAAGHQVEIIVSESDWLRLMVTPGVK